MPGCAGQSVKAERAGAHGRLLWPGVKIGDQAQFLSTDRLLQKGCEVIIMCAVKTSRGVFFHPSMPWRQEGMSGLCRITF